MALPPHPRDQRPGLKPPRFSLAAVFWTLTACCAFFGLTAWLSPHAVFVLILLILAIVAHVAGNSLGTQLRDNGGPPPRRASPSPLGAARRPPSPTPAGALGRRAALGWVAWLAACVGFLAAAALGGWGLRLLYGPLVGVWNLPVGMAACGVLGGLLGFLCGGFAIVLLGAHQEAARGERREA